MNGESARRITARSKSTGLRCSRLRWAILGLLLLGCAASAKPEATGNELSQRCEELAARLQAEGQAQTPNEAAGAPWELKAHYNANRDRCYYVEASSELVRSPAMKRILPREKKRLWDASEKRKLGEYDGWDDVPPLTCWVRSSRCTSKADWIRLVKPYMEE